MCFVYEIWKKRQYLDQILFELYVHDHRLVTVHHYVRVKSTAPAIAGQEAQIYVREVVLAGTALRGSSVPGGVVLFVHGAGAPGEVAFDIPYQDYSWMAFLAKAILCAPP